MIRSLAARAVTLLVLFLGAGSAFAQLQSGNIFGSVAANDGVALGGVTVTLRGPGAPQVQETDSLGRFRFLNLSPGTYSLEATLQGFSPVTRNGVIVNIGRNSEVNLQLAPAVSEAITVTTDAPLLDVRGTGTGATITSEELEQIPTARDPWAILQQVPGVLLDRMNIGGNESGQQSGFASKGTGSDQATYSIDGVNTTDMIATGGSSNYFDFGSFEEIQVLTGSTDPRVQTPGAQLNMVTKRGTNDYLGSGRYSLTDGGTQGSLKVPDEARGYLGVGNEIDVVTEWGAEAGGPIVQDRLWFWGAYSDNDVDLFVAQGQESIDAGEPRYADRTSLETLNAKFNAQLGRSNNATLFYLDSEKVKIGRNASPQRPPETAWNQGGFGPAGTFKLEDTHVFSPSFYLTALYSKVNGGFGLWANAGAGCFDLDCVTRNATRSSVLSAKSGAYRNTYLSVQGERPQEQVRADGSAFFTTGPVNHELKFGLGFRNAGAEGVTHWPNDQFIYDFTGLQNVPDGFGVTTFYAIAPDNYEYDYNDFYAGDTMLWGNLTLQAGLRFDRQQARAGDQVSPGNELAGAYLPALTVKGSDIPAMEWESISPRIGLTYALGENKRTLLRAAYNRYVGQMGSNSTGYTAMIPYYRYVSLYTFDFDRNDRITEGEVLDFETIYSFSGFDPRHPDSQLATRRIDDGINPPSTDEFILGFERELRPNLVGSVNYTHRRLQDFLWFRPEKTRGAGDWYTQDDYVYSTTVSRPGDVNEVDDYTIPVYRLKADVAPPAYFVLTNRDGYSQRYDGIELALVKRMSNRWMMRGNVSVQDWTQNVDDEAILDPTRQRDLGSSQLVTLAGCDDCDGGQVVVPVGAISGAKQGVWINSRWSVNLNGVYQLPLLETSVGANFTMREGYPVLFVHNHNPGDGGGTRNVLVNDVGDIRLENPYSLDLRISKEFRMRGVGLEVAVDAFNVTNYQPALQRNATLATTASGLLTTTDETRNQITELQNPRVLRLGARFTF